MILTKEVNIYLNSKNIKHYKDLGYNIPTEYDKRGRLRIIKEIPIKVKLSDVPLHSKVMIKVQCDECGDIFEIEYVQYNNLKPENKNLCFKCKHNIKWFYNIGENIKKEELDIIIIDRKLINNTQYYKIHCNKCGFDGGKYISVYNNLNRNETAEYWCPIGNIKRMKTCPCCGTYVSMVVKGINDIPTTDPWMIDYFVEGKKEAEKYHSGYSLKIPLKCKDCNELKMFAPNILKQTGYLTCNCRKSISIPNKIAYYVFKSIESQLDYYEREYSPEWLRKYNKNNYKYMSYDNYFIINSTKYIVEMDGGLGHGKKKYKSQETDIDGLKRDLIKNKAAQENGVNLIRVDCPDGNYHQTYNNLLDKIKNIVNIGTINEKNIMDKVHENFVKKICEYYENNKEFDTMESIANYFNIHIRTLRDYLIFGNKYNWCNYVNKNTEKLNDIKPQVIQLYKNGLQPKEIALKLGENTFLIRRYLQAEELIPVRQIDNGKEIYMYDIDKNFIAKYSSQIEIERTSKNDFGIELRSRSISRVCTGERKSYKGYIFSFTPLESQSDDSLLLCSNE